MQEYTVTLEVSPEVANEIQFSLLRGDVMTCRMLPGMQIVEVMEIIFVKVGTVHLEVLFREV